MRRILLLVAVLSVLTLPLVAVHPAAGHEVRKVGAYQMTVGWADEPTFVGSKNAVQVSLKDAKGKPVLDLGDSLKVEVFLGDQKSELLTLDPAFDLEEGFGTPGDYQAPLIPTRPGTYKFHFIGSVKGQKIDQAFTSSDKTFDSPRDATEVEFPVKDPSAAELASRVERLGPRIDAVQAAASAGPQARVLSIVAIVLGAVSLLVRGRGRSA